MAQDCGPWGEAGTNFTFTSFYTSSSLWTDSSWDMLLSDDMFMYGQERNAGGAFNRNWQDHKAVHKVGASWGLKGTFCWLLVFPQASVVRGKVRCRPLMALAVVRIPALENVQLHLARHQSVRRAALPCGCPLASIKHNDAQDCASKAGHDSWTLLSNHQCCDIMQCSSL